MKELSVAESTVGVALIGLGTVGGGVVKMLQEMSASYTRRTGRTIEVRRVLVRDVAKAKGKKLVPEKLLTSDVESFFATPGVSIVVEAAGGLGMFGPLVRAMKSGKHVVTANKALLAARGPELFAAARKAGTCIAFEASCAGGIPIINALQFGLVSNDIIALYGIINGTCNYILTEMTRAGKSYETALHEAQVAGYAEADPTLDVSGRDAAEKLSILATLAFRHRIDPDEVPCEGIDKLDLTDIKFARELGYDIKLLGIAQRECANGKAKGSAQLCVRPVFLRHTLPMAQVHGSFNAVAVYGRSNGHTLYVGRGAGEGPTASAVVSDIVNIAAGWYPQAFAAAELWPTSSGVAPLKVADPKHFRSRFYLRFNALDKPGTLAKITASLGKKHISISSVLQPEQDLGKYVPVVVVTDEADESDVRAAIKPIHASSIVTGKTTCIPIVEMPQG
jgi:homoserine dehydrogenase